MSKNQNQKNVKIIKITPMKKQKKFTEYSDTDLVSPNLPDVLGNKIQKNVRLQESTKRKPDPITIFTDPEDLKEKLKYYDRVESKNIADIPLGSRVKYIEVLEDNRFKYKPGGVIIVNKAPQYLILAENKKSWSVQLDRHIIFVERFELARKHYENTIKKLTDRVKEVTELNKKLRRDILALEKNKKKR
jgi:hypothetical protein